MVPSPTGERNEIGSAPATTRMATISEAATPSTVALKWTCGRRDRRRAASSGTSLRRWRRASASAYAALREIEIGVELEVDVRGGSGAQHDAELGADDGSLRRDGVEPVPVLGPQPRRATVRTRLMGRTMAPM